MTRWTHALRRPGPHPDQCVAEVVELGTPCLCNAPALQTDAPGQCAGCGHELVPAYSVPAGLHRPPEPRR